MAAIFDKAIRSVLVHEGGLVNDPDDPGGITNFGITLSWLRQFEPQATAETIIRMKKEEAVSRYHTYIWMKRGYGYLESTAVAEKIMDMAINFGEERGNIIAQVAANSLGAKLDADGDLGRLSIAALNSLPPRALVDKMKELASDRYKRIVEKRPASRKFLAGWLIRANCATYSLCKHCKDAKLAEESVP